MGEGSQAGLGLGSPLPLESLPLTVPKQKDAAGRSEGAGAGGTRTGARALGWGLPCALLSGPYGEGSNGKSGCAPPGRGRCGGGGMAQPQGPSRERPPQGALGGHCRGMCAEDRAGSRAGEAPAPSRTLGLAEDSPPEERGGAGGPAEGRRRCPGDVTLRNRKSPASSAAMKRVTRFGVKHTTSGGAGPGRLRFGASRPFS